MNETTLTTMIKTAAKEANLTVRFFTVAERVNKKGFKLQYEDEGGRSTHCTDCPSKLVVYAYIDREETEVEVNQKLQDMFNKINAHYERT